LQQERQDIQRKTHVREMHVEEGFRLADFARGLSTRTPDAPQKHADQKKEGIEEKNQSCRI